MECGREWLLGEDCGTCEQKAGHNGRCGLVGKERREAIDRQIGPLVCDENFGGFDNA